MSNIFKPFSYYPIYMTRVCLRIEFDQNSVAASYLVLFLHQWFSATNTGFVIKSIRHGPCSL